MHWDILLIYGQRDQSAKQIYEEIVRVTRKKAEKAVVGWY